MLEGADHVAVGILRVRSETDTPLVRAGVRADVRRCDLRPAGLGRHGILIVRRIGAALEGGFGPSSIGQRRWVQDPRASVQDALRAAARPAQGRPHPSAVAVMFDDRVEMLASYLVDVAEGMARQCWWWDALRPQLGSTESVHQILVGIAEHAAAVFGSMTPNQTEVVASCLSGSEAVDVAMAVAGVVGARPVVELLQNIPVVGSEPKGTVQIGRPLRPGHNDSSSSSSSSVPAEPPWAPLAPDHHVSADLPLSHRLLLGICVVGAARPAVMRSSAFVSSLQQWLVDEATERSTSGADGFQSADVTLQRSSDGPSTGADSNPAPQPGDWQGEPPRHGEAAIQDEGAAGVQPPTEAPRAIQDSDTGRPSGDPDSQPGRAGRAAKAPPPNAQTESGRPAAVNGAVVNGHTDGLVSQLAGGFLLIGLLRRLGLPQRFESDHRLDSVVGGWALLEAITRCLMPDGEHDGDPLWSALTELGGGFGAHDVDELVPTGVAFQPPAEWLEPLGLPAGAQLEPFDLASTLASRLGGGLGEWLSASMPYIASAAEVMVGVPAAELATEIVLRRGHLQWDRTHVDVVFSLEHVSLPVRRSGLDRDPGWTPEFGRVITFHFE